MSRRSDYLAQRVRRNMRDKALITLRHVLLASGPDPLPNPPRCAALVIVGTPLAGASSITIGSTQLEGRVVAGDIFRVGTMVLTAAANATSASNQVTVTITAPLASGLSAGDAVTPTWVADEEVRAIVTPFSIHQADGSMIEARDYSVVIPAAGLKAVPKPTDRVRLADGGWRDIITISPAMVDGASVHYRLQVR